MKQLWDKIRSTYKISKQPLLFFTIIACIGIVTGTFLMILLSKSDNELVQQYMNEFIVNVTSKNYNYLNNLINIVVTNIGLVLLIWILGISIIGIPIILLLLFSKCFILGFTVSAFIKLYNFKGIVYALSYIFPHHIISLILLIYLCTYALYCSLKLLTAIIKRQSIDFKQIMNKYRLILVTSLIGILITSLYENFVTYNLMQLIISIIN